MTSPTPTMPSIPQEPSPRGISRTRLVIIVAVVAVLVVGLFGGIVLLRRQSDTTVIPNTGKTLLYLSSPTFTDSATLLTMVRTSDGKILWQYNVSGSVSTGTNATLNAGLANGQGVTIVNGVIYFIADPDRLGSADRQQRLIALRASDGSVLWQQPVTGAVLELEGVSDGVLCLRVDVQYSAIQVQELDGFNATTGARVWQRQWKDIVGAQSVGFVPYTISLVGGLLYLYRFYVTTASATTYVLLPSTGQTLWRYALPTSESHKIARISPVPGPSGVAVLYTASGFSGPTSAASSFASLTGFNASTGKTLWTYQLPSPVSNLPFGGPNATGIIEQAGALYCVTTAADGTLWLNRLEASNGHLQWHQQLTTEYSAFWDLAVDNANVYAVYAVYAQPYTGTHPTFDGLTVTAVDQGRGSVRWRQQPQVSTFSQLATTNGVALLQTNTTLSGLKSADGSVAWQESATGQLVAFAGAGVLSSVVSTGKDTWTGTLSGVDASTGKTRWSRQFPTSLAAVIPGP